MTFLSTNSAGRYYDIFGHQCNFCIPVINVNWCRPYSANALYAGLWTLDFTSETQYWSRNPHQFVLDFAIGLVMFYSRTTTHHSVSFATPYLYRHWIRCPTYVISETNVSRNPFYPSRLRSCDECRFARRVAPCFTHSSYLVDSSPSCFTTRRVCFSRQSPEGVRDMYNSLFNAASSTSMGLLNMYRMTWLHPHYTCSYSIWRWRSTWRPTSRVLCSGTW